MANVRPQGAEGKQNSMREDAEEFVYDLLSRIQPAPASELRRKNVARYVQDTIARAFQPTFEVQAFMYGSVPLKTYLPDGDIDLAIFHSRGNIQHLRDSWFTQLSTFLRQEENNPHAPFRIQDVQVIYAEVKLVKCLVDNIVVDISFQSLGGLCTVNFLEAIDRKIDDHHLFKRSIILVKAWCYYESRLLGAHHGLISTYALETMVLYIFITHHKIVDTPLKVLHKFLTVFSTFDWDSKCLSLMGPIPLITFPNPKPTPFQLGDQPLLTEEFMADVRSKCRLPGISSESMPAIGPRSFQLKFLNIMDPLLPTNNLGRSVNRASFARVKRALAIGARRLTELLEMDRVAGGEAVKSFFRNTWNAQRTPSQQAPLQEVPVVNGHAPLRQNGANGLQVDRQMHSALAALSAKHPPQHHLSLPPGSTAQASYQPYRDPNLQRWIAQQQKSQSSSAPTVQGFPSRPSQPSSARATPQNGSHFPDTPKTETQRSANLVKATSAELKSNAVDLQEASEAQVKKAIPARKAPSGTPSNTAKLRKLATQVSESPPEGPGRLGSWKEPPSPQIAMPVCLGHQVVNINNNQQLIPMWTHVSMPLGQFSPAVYRQYPVYHLGQQHLRPPLNGIRNNQLGQPVTANGQSKSVPNSAKSQRGLGTARFSDPGSSIPAERQHSLDVTLAGDLDGLHHHLESARAMFTPHLSNGHHPAGVRGDRDPSGTRTPLRPSSSMGNLAHQKPMANLGHNGWQNSFLPAYMLPPFELHHIPYANTNSNHHNLKQRQYRPPYAMPESQHQPKVQAQAQPPPAPESLTSTSGPPGSSDVGSSRADSPGPSFKQPPGPPGTNRSAVEWPLPGGKAAGWTPETMRAPLPRSSASEGWPGWASPVGSTESTASLPAMRHLRLDDQDPSIDRVKPTEPAEANGQREVGTSNHLAQSEWQKEFLLDNEKDFPGLPNTKPGSNGVVRNAEASKSWRPVSSNVKAR